MENDLFSMCENLLHWTPIVWIGFEQRRKVTVMFCINDWDHHILSWCL